MRAATAFRCCWRAPGFPLRSVSRYRRFGSLFSGVFSKNLLVAAQSAEDAERFKSIGAACGTDSNRRQCEIRCGSRCRQRSSGQGAARCVWPVRGRSGSPAARMRARKNNCSMHMPCCSSSMPNAVLLLVPRHTDRFAAVAELLARRGVRFARRSRMASGAEAPQLPSDTPVLLVDTVGELTTLYAVRGCGICRRQPGGRRRAQSARARGAWASGADGTLLLQRQGNRAIVAGARRGIGEYRAPKISRRRCSGCWRSRRRASRCGIIGKEIIAANRGSVARLLALIVPWLPPAGHQTAARGAGVSVSSRIDSLQALLGQDAGGLLQLDHIQHVVIAAVRIVGLRLHPLLPGLQHIHRRARSRFVARFGGAQRR